MKKHLLLILASATLLFGCKENKQNPSGTTLTLSKSESTISVGESETLAVTSPVEYVNSSINWTSLNNEIATVDTKGKVTAIRPGQAIVVGFVEGLNGVRGECIVTVSAPKMTLSQHDKVISLGEELALTYQYSVPVAKGWEVGIATSDSVSSEIVTVKTKLDPNKLDKDGNPVNYDPKTGLGKFSLIGVRPGVVNVIVKNKFSAKSLDSIKIVVEPAAIKDIILSLNNKNSTGVIPANGTTDSVLVAFDPVEFKGLPVKFLSLAPSILEVDANGKLTPKASSGSEGTIMVSTMFAKDNVSKTIKIKIGAPTKVEKISFVNKTATVQVGGAGTLIEVKSEAGDQYTVNVVSEYEPKVGQKSNVQCTPNYAKKGIVVTAGWDQVSTGTAKVAVVSSKTDKEGKPITDTCLVTVAGFSSALGTYTKTVYNSVNLGKDVAVKASVVDITSRGIDYTVNSVKLVVPKGAVYQGKKQEADKVIEEITTAGTPISNGVYYVFQAVPSKFNNAAEFKSFEVRYKLTSQAGIVYELSDVVSKVDDGANFVNKL